MLRVAGVAKIIVDAWTGAEIDGSSIIKACLFHDMANILKFDFSNRVLMGDEADRVDYWQSVQTEVRTKYGDDIHAATMAICREIGLAIPVLRLVENLKWDAIAQFMKANDSESLIPIYCDMRVGPFGVSSLNERITNLQTRRPIKNFDELIASAEELEKELQKNVSIDLRAIANHHVNDQFSSLLSMEVVA